MPGGATVVTNDPIAHAVQPNTMIGSRSPTDLSMLSLPQVLAPLCLHMAHHRSCPCKSGDHESHSPTTPVLGFFCCSFLVQDAETDCRAVFV